MSPLINTAARYLNLHHHAGISVEQMQVALVIHGTASDDILSDTAYQKKYGIQNPNTPLLQQLMAEKVSDNVNLLLKVLEGEKGPHRDIVLLNTAGVLIAGDLAANFEEGIRRATEAIDSGKAKIKLQELLTMTQSF